MTNDEDPEIGPGWYVRDETGHLVPLAPAIPADAECYTTTPTGTLAFLADDITEDTPPDQITTTR